MAGTSPRAGCCGPSTTTKQCMDAEGNAQIAAAAFLPCLSGPCGGEVCDYIGAGGLTRGEIFVDGATFDGAVIDGATYPASIAWDSTADPTGAAFKAAIESWLVSTTGAASANLTLTLQNATALAFDWQVTGSQRVITSILASPVDYPQAMAQQNCQPSDQEALRVNIVCDERPLSPPTPKSVEVTRFGTGTNIPAGFKAVHINNLSGVTRITNTAGETYELGNGRRDNSIDIIASAHHEDFNGCLEAFTITGGTWQWFGIR